MQRDTGASSRPDLVLCPDLPDSDGPPDTVVRGFWSIACQTLAAHEVAHPITADGDAFSGQVVHRPAAAATRILRVQNINPGHDPQGRFTHRCRPVVMHRSG